MKTKNILIFLLLLLSLGALGGGGAFILFPQGWMGMTPESQLSHSPFPNFLIPGLILFTVLGVLPLVVAWGLWKQKNCRIAQALNIFPDMHWSWSWSLYVGFALQIWIYAEVYFLQGFHILHHIYFTLGIVILVVTMLTPIRTYYHHPRLTR